MGATEDEIVRPEFLDARRGHGRDGRVAAPGKSRGEARGQSPGGALVTRETVDRGAQLRKRDGLSEDQVERFVTVRELAQRPAVESDADGRPARAHGADDVPPVHVRHVQIRQHEIDQCAAFHSTDRFSSTRGRNDRVSFGGEQERYGLQHDLVVVDQQDVHPGTSLVGGIEARTRPRVSALEKSRLRSRSPSGCPRMSLSRVDQGKLERRYSKGANCASRQRIASPRPRVRRISSNAVYSGVPWASRMLHASTPYWSAPRSPIVSKVLLMARLFHCSAASATRDMRLAIFIVSRSRAALGNTRSTSPSLKARSALNVSPV